MLDFQASFPLADALGVNTPIYFAPWEDSQGEQKPPRFPNFVNVIEQL
jgi:hypothetical protein